MKASFHLNRLSKQLQQQCARLLTPLATGDFVGLTINAVDLSNDQSILKIYVTILHEAHQEQLITSLNEQAGTMRYQLAQSVKLRKTPELRFFYDRALMHGRKIEQLLQTRAGDV